MIGILTEKPSAARNFAKALGGQSGTYNGEQYLIVNALGHLYEFDQPENMVAPGLAEKYKSWDLSGLPWDETAFSWKRVLRGDVASVVDAIKKGLSQCDEIVIATDVDPTGEGELLAWEILDELHLRPRKWSRMYFDDESAKEIQKAFVSRKQIPSMLQDMDYVKADYRSKFDFLTMQFTRIATRSAGGRTLLRQGRLKSAMVLVVGDQLAKVAAYKKVPFYQNKFRDDHGVVYTDPDAQTYPDKAQVPGGLHASAVDKDSAVMKRTVPPKMLDLAALSARLSSKGYKAKQVLADEKDRTHLLFFVDNV